MSEKKDSGTDRFGQNRDGSDVPLGRELYGPTNRFGVHNMLRPIRERLADIEKRLAALEAASGPIKDGNIVRVRPIFAWYDLWIGVFIDRPNQRVYVFPLPMLGLRIDLRGSGPIKEANDG